MTYARFISNAEQMSAHCRDFDSDWNSYILPVLVAENPHLTPYEILVVKQNAWSGHLIDAHIDACLGPEGL